MELKNALHCIPPTTRKKRNNFQANIYDNMLHVYIILNIIKGGFHVKQESKILI